MGQRIKLQALLEEILGSRNVYFQPPTNLKMSYPCIVYSLSSVDANHADNRPYTLFDRYSIEIIDKNPDSLIPRKIASLPTASFDRIFVYENLNHFVYTLQY